MVGTFVFGGGSLLVARAHARFCHRRFGIGIGCFEALTVVFLRRAPLHLGHIGEFDEARAAGGGTAEDAIAQFTVDTLDHGAESDLYAVILISGSL